MKKYNPNKFLLKIPRKPSKSAVLSLALVMAKTETVDELDRSRFDQLEFLKRKSRSSHKLKAYNNY